MIKRKLLTALLATPLSLLFIFAVFFQEWRQPLELIVMTGTFSLMISPIILLYGLPVTFLSDFIRRRLKWNELYRTGFAFTLHIAFAVLFGLVFPDDTTLTLFSIEVSSFIIFSSIAALFFWAIDEKLRRTNKFKS